jgi:predicted nucleotidyltransferase
MGVDYRAVLMYTLIMKKEIVDIIKNYFGGNKLVCAVYLFGSRARGDGDDLSDIDLGVLFNRKKVDNLDLRLQFESEIGQKTEREVDVCDIEEVELLFAYRILSEGVLVYTSDEDRRIDFEVRLMQNYFDMKSFFEEYYEKVRRLAKEGKIDARPITN